MRTFCDSFAGAAACAVDRPIWPYIKNLRHVRPDRAHRGDPRPAHALPQAQDRERRLGGRAHEPLMFGASESDRVAARDALRAFLLNSIDNGIALSEQHATPLVIISDPGQDQDDEMALVMLLRAHRAFVKCSDA